MGEISLREHQKNVQTQLDDSFLSINTLKVPETSRPRKSKQLQPGTSQTVNAEEYIYFRTTELEQEIRFLHSIFLKNKLSVRNSPEKKMLFENDLLEIQIREWKYKIEDTEVEFNALKKDYSIIINALLKAQQQNSETYEISEMRELLRNRKNDAYEVNCLIKELNKVAWDMLPPKIADNCREVDQKMDDLRIRYEDLQFTSHNLRVTIFSTKKEIAAIKAATDEENKKRQLLQMKIRKTREVQDIWTKRVTKIRQRLGTATEILKSYGLTIGEFVYENGRIRLASHSNDENSDPVSEAFVIEMIQPLVEKIKELDNEIAEVKTDLERNRKSNNLWVEDVKKQELIKKEIKNLTLSRDRFKINLQQEIILRKSYYNEIEDLKGKIRVFCRCRPISEVEKKTGNLKCVNFPDVYTVTVSGLNSERANKEFQFDRVFPPESTQDEIFADSSKLIQSAFDGYNVCIFAYGQTGSGKTYTLIGNLDRNPGIVPKAFTKIFGIINDGKIKFKADLRCYMLELYNEKLLDLMTPGAEYSDKLEIKKDINGMVIIPGAELLPAADFTTLTELFIRGNKNRHIASTKMNSESSRSHLILSIMINCRMISSDKLVCGKMSIIDLAGSERLGKSGVKGVGAQEAMSINMSLSALGDVISALTLGQQFVPYRNNKLTMLMQDSLGGNAKTLMFVNISPVDYNRIETVSSLTYGARVKLIKNDALKVADPDEMIKLQNILDLLLRGEDVII